MTTSFAACSAIGNRRNTTPSEVVRRLQRARWTPHLVLGLEVLGCCLALGVGVWFAWVAAHQTEHKLLFTLSAAVLLIAAPVLGVATALARRPSLAWDDETPESILRIGIRRAEASLQAMRVGRWHVAIIAGFVALLWALQLAEVHRCHGVSGLLLHGVSRRVTGQLDLDGVGGPGLFAPSATRASACWLICGTEPGLQPSFGTAAPGAGRTARETHAHLPRRRVAGLFMHCSRGRARKAGRRQPRDLPK